MNGGYSAYSGGPVRDTTPQDPNLSNRCHVMTDAQIQNTPYGPPYGVPSNDSAEFDRLKNKLAKQKGVTDPAALAASIERKKGLIP